MENASFKDAFPGQLAGPSDGPDVGQVPLSVYRLQLL